MTVDWFVLLTPIVLLIVILPFVFIGCTEFKTAEGSTTTAPPPAIPPTPAPPPVVTFRLSMDPNLQNGLNPQQQVVRIEAFFRIQDSTGTAAAIERPQPHLLIKNTQQPPPNPPAIDPQKEVVPPVTVPEPDFGARDEVQCDCVVTLANGNTPNVQLDKPVQLQPGHGLVYQFRIRSRKPNQNGFRVLFDGVGM